MALQHPPQEGHGEAGGVGASRIARRFVFALLPACLLLGLFEGALRFGGYEGHPDREVSWCREHAGFKAPFLHAMSLDGRPATYIAPSMAAHPRPLPYEKAPHEKRIFVLGSSAAHGYGFSRNGSFAGRLEEMLAIWPDWDVQVVNLGAIAWSSQQQLQLVKEILASHQPDLIVLHDGNNELLEWWDWRQFLPDRACRTFVTGLRWNRRFSRLRSFLLLRDLLGGPDVQAWGRTDFTDDESLPWPERARLTPTVRDFAVESWRHNVGRIVDLSRSAGVPVILSTVAVNQMDPPGEFPFRGDDVREPKINLERLDRADRAPEAEGERLFEEAWKDWPEAITHWRWGDMYRRHGQVEPARRHLLEAIRLDENPHRTLPEINEATRDLARSSGVFLMDGEATARALSEDGIIGFQQVYDHCHPTLQTHVRLAAALAQVISTEVWPAAAPEFRTVADGMVAEIDARGADSDRVESWLGVDLRVGQAQYPGDPEAFHIAQWQDAISRARDGGGATEWNQAGLLAFHGFHADCVRGRLPCLQDAADAFREAARLDGSWCVPKANLGRLYLEAGRGEEGLDWLGQALACDPTDEASRALIRRAGTWDRGVPTR